MPVSPVHRRVVGAPQLIYDHVDVAGLMWQDLYVLSAVVIGVLVEVARSIPDANWRRTLCSAVARYAR